MTTLLWSGMSDNKRGKDPRKEKGSVAFSQLPGISASVFETSQPL